MEFRPELFKNRKEAGIFLAKQLSNYKNSDSIVLALPRGGIPVAAEISEALNIPIDILAVRKIGVPVFSELAAGAICETDPPYFSENLLLRLGFEPDDLKSIVETESEKLKIQIELFRSGKPLPSLTKKNVIIVDDGLATGATIQAAVHFLQKQNPAKIIVAVPVGAFTSIQELAGKVDQIVCPLVPEEFLAVNQFYENFDQVENDDALQILNKVRLLQKESNPVQHVLEQNIIPIKKPEDLDLLIQSLKDTRVIMLGEASHGTHEYYELRATISKRLIEDHGFNFIAVEGDWPDAHRLNQYIHGKLGKNSLDVLLENHRWPTWMWANEEIAKLAEWLRGRDVAFYGLDVYSLFDSIEEIKRYLKKVDPELAKKILKNYACFDPYQNDEIEYAKSLFSFPPGCEKQVTENLILLLEKRLNLDDSLFSAQQNAYIILNAEAYYRAMIKSDAKSWNVRDTHMLETLDRLLERHGEGSKAIVWAHNTHIGDYRATDMLEDGYVNLGGLAREKYGPENVKLVGFGSYQGKVVAGSAWGAQEEIMDLPAASVGSFEWHCHQIAFKNKISRFHLPLKGAVRSLMNQKLLHRAVGVVYDPAEETNGNYVPSELGKRYDDFIFIDKTSALRSLHAHANPNDFPETWPSGV